MMTVKLSLIVPVYKVEKYLHKCVDSLLVQDIPSSEYEIILVDDGSPDSCPQMCDEYATAYSNIRVIHHKNAGLSEARNAGITAAKGNYIQFVDSDDYIEPNVLGGLLSQIERDDLDVLRFRFQNVDERYNVFHPYKRNSNLDNDYSENPTDGITFLNTRVGTQCYASMFVIHRSLLDGCLFTPGIYFEDTDWMPRMLVKAKRVASTNTIVYNYLMRKGSITNAVEYSKQKKVLDDKIYLIALLQKQSETLRAAGKEYVWYSKMIADIVISIVGIISTQFYQERKIYLKQLSMMNVYPIQSRLTKARLINLSPQLTVFILHMKNR